jgi:hypothetical protein
MQFDFSAVSTTLCAREESSKGMKINQQWMTAVLGAALIATPGLAIGQPQTDQAPSAQQDTRSAGQDMKDAGRDTGNAAQDAGHGVKKGTKKAYHSTKKGTKKAWHKTKNTTNGAVNGGKEGAKQPD